MHQCEPQSAGRSWRGHQVEFAKHPQHSHSPDTQHLDRGYGTGTQSADDGNCQQDIEDPFILILFFLHNSEILLIMMKKTNWTLPLHCSPDLCTPPSAGAAAHQRHS